MTPLSPIAPYSVDHEDQESARGVEVKKKQISIGPGVSIDLDKLMTGRLLLQATSGAGKSWLLRRLLEQSHGMCQQIVIDPEGEFSTLREKFDYVLAAKQGGDTLADVRTAKLLAERLLELGVSAIIDIYELNPDQRVKFVRAFLEAMVDAPKHLWHPVLVVIDEAHTFCPEKDEAESATAVKALCTRGRKRGFCAVLATQRLPTLAKDAAAMCANKLIGRASLDIDMWRSGAEIGYGKPESRVLRDLEDGEFYAFGPAISKIVTKVKVGDVQTTHPQAGTQLAARVPPPTDKVKALLPKLSDLPAEAADRERTTAEMKKAIVDKDRRIKELERASENSSRNVSEKLRDVPALTDADRALIEKLTGRLTELEAKLTNYQASAVNALDDKLFAAFAAFIEGSRDRSTAHAEELSRILDTTGVKKLLEKLNGLATGYSQPKHPFAGQKPSQVVTTRAVGAHTAGTGNLQHFVRTATSPKPQGNGAPPEGVTGVQQRILNALAEAEQLSADNPDRSLVALLSGYTHIQSTGFVKALGALSTAGMVTYPRSGLIALTDAGRAAAQAPGQPTTAEELQERVIALIGGAASKVLRPLINASGQPISRQDLATASGYGHIQSTGFVKTLGRLRTLGFIDYPSSGMVVAQPVLFLEGR